MSRPTVRCRHGKAYFLDTVSLFKWCPTCGAVKVDNPWRPKSARRWQSPTRALESKP